MLINVVHIFKYKFPYFQKLSNKWSGVQQITDITLSTTSKKYLLSIMFFVNS